MCGITAVCNRICTAQKGENMNDIKMISDAAKEVNVENHVLRYWEEELRLPIKRNELGHRYYTKEDVERFKQIKSMKERGLQLKAINFYLKNGNFDVISASEDAGTQELNAKIQGCNEENSEGGVVTTMAIDIVDNQKAIAEIAVEDKENKSKRLQWLLQQLIRETLRENNQELCREIKESVVKELDYQFRVQEEREDERERRQVQRNEEYYKKMDQLLRNRSRRTKKETVHTGEEDGLLMDTKKEGKKDKKKRHSIF